MPPSIRFWDRPTNVGLCILISQDDHLPFANLELPNPRFARPQLANITERSPGCEHVEVAVWFLELRWHIYPQLPVVVLITRW